MSEIKNREFHKKYILSHHLLAHIVYEIYFSVAKANISLSYVSVCKIKYEIRTYFINSIGILVFNCDRHA